MKYILEKQYAVIYTPKGCTYENYEQYIATSIEEAISMCRDKHKDCEIEKAEKINSVYRKSTKTVTVEI